MKINSFEDIKAIDEELAYLFLRPDEAVNWIYAVNNGIKDWVANNKTKQNWEIVRYVSEQRGILGKLKSDGITIRLTRDDFALVLLKFCPNAVKKGETQSALTASMNKFKYLNALRNIDTLLTEHVVRHLIRDVENILDNKPIIESKKEDKKPELENILIDYIRKDIDEKSNKFPKSKVNIRPQYGDICPAVSLETYKSEQLLNNHNPTHIEAYEFIDGVLKKNKLYELSGQYVDKRMKLFIVSPCGLTPDVRALATDRSIGYVMLNPKTEMTSESFILPRSIEDHAKQQYYLDVLEGTKPMNVPMLIMNGEMLTESLTDVLSANGVAVKEHRLLDVPFMPEEDIEQKVNDLIKEEIENKMHYLDEPNADLAINPFACATQCGLDYQEEEMAESQLGRLILGKPNRVILNSIDIGDATKARKRFTMAHELGHHILHSPLFNKQGVVSVGESEDTLITSKSNSRRLELQANLFASSLLMPKVLVEALYNIYYTQLFHREPRPLYYNPEQSKTWDCYNNIVGKLSNTLQVSNQAMNIRLKSMKLLKTPK